MVTIDLCSAMILIVSEQSLGYNKVLSSTLGKKKAIAIPPPSTEGIAVGGMIDVSETCLSLTHTGRQVSW